MKFQVLFVRYMQIILLGGSLLFAFTRCSQAPTAPQKTVPPVVPQLTTYLLSKPPVWDAFEQSHLVAGGFSGLIFTGYDAQHSPEFMSHTDRGANAEALPAPQGGKPPRPFLVPRFQPRWMKLALDQQTHTLQITQEIRLTDPKGEPLTGLPQPGDEVPVDVHGKRVPYDLMGIDPESLAVDDQGFVWMGEEYRPSLLKFDQRGRLIKRYSPKNSLPPRELAKLHKKYGPHVVEEALPEVFRYRRLNRGFEGMTFFHGHIFAVVQSPLEVPEDQAAHVARMLEFDPKTEKVVAEYKYPFTRDGVDKIGDLNPRPDHDQLCAIEQNGDSGPEGVHLITCFAIPTGEDKMLKPQVLVDLTQIGYDFADKVEGLAFLNADTFAIVNDNDFGAEGIAGAGPHSVTIDTTRPTILGIVHLK